MSPLLCFNGAVNNQQIALIDLSAGHGSAGDADKECRRRVSDEIPVQVQARVRFKLTRRARLRLAAADNGELVRH